ncbi:MAG: type IIL restriction-modification enzyme MmeI, partial [Verrucomicrobiia bacterium]
KRGSGPASKEYELDFNECEQISSALSDQTDVSAAGALSCNTEPQRCFNGQMVGHKGLLLSEEQLAAITRKDPKSAEVIYPYLNGVDALTGLSLDRYVIDFEQRNQLEAASYPGAFDWVKTHVLPDRERKAKEGVDKDGKMRPHHKAFLSRWWQLSFGRPEMLSVIKPLPRFLACAYVTKRPIFMFVSSAIRPSNLIQVFGFADDYSSGVLQSHAHWLWFVTKCGKLKSDFRYSAESVFDTFPWPQFVGRVPDPASAGDRRVGDAAYIARIDAVAAAAREVRRVRAEALTKLKGGLRALYRTLELPGANPLRDAHAALDAAVLAAYGFNAKKDLLAQLLALNQEVAAKIEKGDPVTAPGVPKGYPDPAKLVTEDCIRAAES